MVSARPGCMSQCRERSATPAAKRSSRGCRAGWGVCVDVQGGTDPQRHRGGCTGSRQGGAARVPSAITDSSCSGHVFAFACLIFSTPFATLVPAPSLHLSLLLPILPLLFLFVLFLLPVASSRPRGRRCGILRPVGSPPRSPWELTWRPAGSGGPCRYTQPRAEGGGPGGAEPAPRRRLTDACAGRAGASPAALPCSRLGRGTWPRGCAALSPWRG